MTYEEFMKLADGLNPEPIDTASADEIKAKYYLQSREETGVFKNIVIYMNDFVQKYDILKKQMNEGVSKLRETYLMQSNEWKEKYANIMQIFNTGVSSLRQTTIDNIESEIAEIRNRVISIVTVNVSDEAMNDIKLIRNIGAENLSDVEVKTYLKKHEKNYLIVKSIISLLAKEQKERLGIRFYVADDIMEGIDEAESIAVGFCKNYNASLTHGNAVILEGSMIKKANEAFESFVSVYE